MGHPKDLQYYWVTPYICWCKDTFKWHCMDIITSIFYAPIHHFFHFRTVCPVTCPTRTSRPRCWCMPATSCSSANSSTTPTCPRWRMPGPPPPWVRWPGKSRIASSLLRFGVSNVNELDMVHKLMSVLSFLQFRKQRSATDLPPAATVTRTGTPTVTRPPTGATAPSGTAGQRRRTRGGRGCALLLGSRARGPRWVERANADFKWLSARDLCSKTLLYAK